MPNGSVCAGHCWPAGSRHGRQRRALSAANEIAIQAWPAMAIVSTNVCRTSGVQVLPASEEPEDGKFTFRTYIHLAIDHGWNRPLHCPYRRTPVQFFRKIGGIVSMQTVGRVIERPDNTVARAIGGNDRLPSRERIETVEKLLKPLEDGGR